MKDPVPLLNQSNVVYEFCCPGCNAKYIGKTERTLYERSMEHAWYDKNSAIRHHIDNCDALQYINRLMLMGDNSLSKEDIRLGHINIVQQNLKVIDKSKNWSIILLKEAIYIKDRSPLLNSGLKASRELQLFV